MSYNRGMHLILTHEQADLDALGAMLGAALMNTAAYPVLPRRMNRNCRAFLALYGVDLPFIEAADLPNGPVETITLVDTQSLITLKGVSPRTAVQVVDHHTRRPDLPASWQVSTQICGACTTLFVEGLREQDGSLTPLQATLLLLGIYEDTGSLSYTTTTARDALAVSYLLDKGASLQLASRSLNHPLSTEQRAVFDRLLSAAQTLTIQNNTIVVAAAEAPELTDEISTIAHKLRDLLDPAALFVLVSTIDGIRIVARSTTDRVDVSTLAAHFGGGGHARAAAALVRLPSPLAPGADPLLGVRDALLALLPEIVQPTVTVQALMSRHPRLLDPGTPLEEAARLMRRYGYEGFPVVSDGKILGLLTRRAVDRALAHKIDRTAGSLMEAGEVFVRADDSIDRLREVMIQSGWGQVPVTDPASGKIVGIATRTDLLKQMGESPARALTSNLAQKLDAAMPPARLALLHAVAVEAHHLHLAIYIVGGFVRDLILSRPGLDFDIVVEGDAIALGHALEHRFGGRIVAHTRFGTAKWTIGPIRAALAAGLAADLGAEDPETLNPADLPDSLDLISARTEFYDYPTALPTVERSSIKLDLHRRDFTINTLALRLDGDAYGDLYDHWGGLRDLREGRVRVLHSLSFVDDPTRQLRAVRFEQRFGFTIEARTIQLMRESVDLIRHLSGDRLRHELNLILAEPRALPMLSRLSELGLLHAIHPDLADPARETGRILEQVLAADPPAVWNLPAAVAHIPIRIALAYLVWLISLPSEKALANSERIRLPGELRDAILAACTLNREIDTLADLRPSELVQRLEGIPILSVYAVFLTTQTSPAGEALLRYAQEFRHIHPLTSGDTLHTLGLAPGPAYKIILAALRSAWLDRSISSPHEEAALLEELIKDHD